MRIGVENRKAARFVERIGGVGQCVVMQADKNMCVVFAGKIVALLQGHFIIALAGHQHGGTGFFQERFEHFRQCERTLKFQIPARADSTVVGNLGAGVVPRVQNNACTLERFFPRVGDDGAFDKINMQGVALKLIVVPPQDPRLLEVHNKRVGFIGGLGPFHAL